MIARGLVALAVLAAVAAAPTVAGPYPVKLLQEILIWGVFAMSLDLLMGYTGMVSFGHSAFFGVGGYVAALALAGPGRLLAASGGNGVFIVPACADGLDDDGDGLVDYPADPGCVSAQANLENPQCDDDLDNDGDGSVDWDGGAAAGSPDPQCTTPSRNREGNACGMGGEVVIALWLLVAFRRALA